MKTLKETILEKLIIKKNYNNGELGQIISILKKQGIENIDKYNEDNLVDDLYYDKYNVIDNIQFEDDYTNVTLFYTLDTGDNFKEGDITIGIEEWYSYISKEDTKRILDKLNDIYK